MATTAIKTSSPATSEFHGVWLTLKFTYGLIPIVAGADKFTNILVDWSKYLNEGLVQMLPVSPDVFMFIVGIIEIIAGIIVLTKTELGAYIVAAWLGCIALTLIISWSYVDVAVRDVAMAIGAITLARLTKIRGQL